MIRLCPFLLFTFLFTFACSSTLPLMSLEEAKNKTVKFRTSSFTPPKRTIDDIRNNFFIKHAFEVIAKPTFEASCKLEEERRKREINAALKAVTAANGTKNFWVGYQRMDYVASKAFMTGEYQAMIGHLKNALLRLGTKKVTGAKARYHSLIALFYAELGNEIKAFSHQQRALVNWRETGMNGLPKVLLYQHAVKSALAGVNGNLIAEEYYLREIERIREQGVSRSITKGISYSHFYSRLITNLVMQNRAVEAELLARARLNRGWTEGYGSLLVALSKALFKQHRLVDAEFAARSGLAVYQSQFSKQDGIPLNEARRNMISILLAQGKLREINDLYKNIETAFNENTDRFKELYGNNRDLLLVDVLINPINEMRNATVIEDADSLEDQEYNSILALANKISGKNQDAFKLFKQNFIPLLEKVNTKDIASLELKNRVSLIHKEFMDLLVVMNQSNSGGEINIPNLLFQLSEYSNNSSVQTALNASSARAAVDSPELSKLIRQTQDTEEQIKSITDKLSYFNLLGRDQVSWQLMDEMEKRILQLRAAQRTLQLEVEKNFPRYAELINPRPPTLQSVRRILKENEALIVIKSTASGSFVWAVPFEGEPQFHYSNLGQSQVTEIVTTLRSSLDPKASTLGEIPTFDIKQASKLFQDFLSPVQKGWEQEKHLFFVTQGSLGQLPMGVLPKEKVSIDVLKAVNNSSNIDTRGITLKKKSGSTPSAQEYNKVTDDLLFAQYKKVPWIIKSHSVTQLPSVGSFVALRGKRSNTGSSVSFAGFGDPIFSPEQFEDVNSTENVKTAANNNSFASRAVPLVRRSAPNTRDKSAADLSLLPPLPDTANEVVAIAASLGAQSTGNIFLQKNANEASIKNMDLSKQGVIVFATHGLVPGDLDGLTQPALAFTNPNILNSKEDGLLTMGEILGLRLSADCVVLSACNTASASESGSEAMSGLGRAFFYAGARSLLVTHWPVETRSAQLLTTEIFKQQAGNSTDRANALRLSQLKLMNGPGSVNENGQSVFSYAHPIFWAAFSLVGDRI